MNQPTVQQVIEQLVSRGKQPSLALLKARLGHSVPLPQLIQALQQWRADPQSVTAEAAQPEAPAAQDDTPDISDVMAELRALRREVAELRDLVKKQ